MKFSFRKYTRTDDDFLSLDTGKKGFFVCTLEVPQYPNEMTIIWESYGLWGSQHTIERVPKDKLITISPNIIGNERTLHVLLMGAFGESRLLDLIVKKLTKENKDLAEAVKNQVNEINMSASTNKITKLGRNEGFEEEFKKMSKLMGKEKKGEGDGQEEYE